MLCGNIQQFAMVTKPFLFVYNLLASRHEIFTWHVWGGLGSNQRPLGLGELNHLEPSLLPAELPPQFVDVIRYRHTF